MPRTHNDASGAAEAPAKVTLRISTHQDGVHALCRLPAAGDAHGDYTRCLDSAGAPALLHQSQHVDYVGRSRVDDDLQFMFGVCRRSKGTVTVFPATVFHVEQQFKTKKRRLEEEGALEAKSEAATSALVDTFGSRRDQDAMASKKRNRLTSGMLKPVDAAMSMASSRAAEVPVWTDVVKVDSELMPMPPHHPEGRSPAEVYCLDELAPPEEASASGTHMLMNIGREQIEQWRSGQIREPRFVLQLCESKLMGMRRGVARTRFANQLWYLRHILRFGSYGKIQELVDGDVGQSMPALVKESFLQRFAEEYSDGERTTYICSQTSKDKLRLHALALGLALGDFAVDLAALVGDLRLRGGDATKYIRALGASIKTRELDGGETTERFTTLPVPVKFPKARPLVSRK